MRRQSDCEKTLHLTAADMESQTSEYLLPGTPVREMQHGAKKFVAKATACATVVNTCLLRSPLSLGPRRQPEGALPRLVIHLVGVDVVTPRAATVDGPRATLNLHVLRVTLVSCEERPYSDFLVTLFYYVVATHDGRLFFASTS
jgi:hypothetical protein